MLVERGGLHENGVLPMFLIKVSAMLETLIVIRLF